MLAAVTVGVLFRGKGPTRVTEKPAGTGAIPPFGKALTAAVSKAVSSTVTVCGYVVLFGALLGVLEPYLALPPTTNALVCGFLELGSGVAAMAGQTLGPVSLAVTALIIGWGGVSVHCQTMGVLAGTDISCARHLAGRALCGVLAAVYTYLGARMLF